MTGLPTDSPLAQKLWLAARIQGHRNPWGKPLVELNIAQLDFILEMSARDDPKSYSFRRGEAVATSEVLAAWASVLTGPALDAFMRGKFNPRATEAWAARRSIGLKPGIREAKPPSRAAMPPRVLPPRPRRG